MLMTRYTHCTFALSTILLSVALLGVEYGSAFAQGKREEQAKIAAEQKVARDARYAARKVGKKQRRQQQKERHPLR